MPYSAPSPRRAKAVENLAPRAANRTSHISAWVSPIPAHAPLIAAISGLRNSRGAYCGRRADMFTGRPATSASLLMSMPGQNDVPAPVSTPTRTAGSASAAASRSKYRFSIGAVHALRRSGRFSVNVATPSASTSVSTRSSSSAIGRPPYRVHCINYHD